VRGAGLGAVAAPRALELARAAAGRAGRGRREGVGRQSNRDLADADLDFEPGVEGLAALRVGGVEALDVELERRPGVLRRPVGVRRHSPGSRSAPLERPRGRGAGAASFSRLTSGGEAPRLRAAGEAPGGGVLGNEPQLGRSSSPRSRPSVAAAANRPSSSRARARRRPWASERTRERSTAVPRPDLLGERHVAQHAGRRALSVAGLDAVDGDHAGDRQVALRALPPGGLPSSASPAARLLQLHDQVPGGGGSWPGPRRAGAEDGGGKQERGGSLMMDPC